MGVGSVRTASAIGLAACLLASCGGYGDGTASSLAPGRLLHGETETGMKLEVATFVDPAGDPKLARLAAYLRAIDLRPVDYHRVTADNTEGALPDRERPVRFALDLAALQTGKSVEARFVCDAVSFEWPPPPAAGKDATDSYRELRESLCANGPAQPRAIQPGEKEVYYLFTERGFAERGIRDMRVFGPLDVELK